jgi:hypothetical protein
MAIDTALKRRAALGRSVLMLPPANSAIDKDDRAILLGLYLFYTSTFQAVATPLLRVFAIARSVSVFAIREDT